MQKHVLRYICMHTSIYIKIHVYHNIHICYKYTLLSFSHLIMSSSLWSHGLQHARLPCPLPSPGVCSNHVHWVSDAIQPSHPLSSPSPPALSLSQHQGLFQGVSSLHQVAKELELQLQQIHTDIIIICFFPCDKICSAYLIHRAVTVHRSVMSDSLRHHELQHRVTG